jgi:ABC-type amino acid transport system permease subunit
MLQSTLFASFISVNEIFRVVQRVNSNDYQSIPIFTTLAVFFLAVCAPMYLLAEAFKRRYTRDFSER